MIEAMMFVRGIKMTGSQLKINSLLLLLFIGQSNAC